MKRLLALVLALTLGVGVSPTPVAAHYPAPARHNEGNFGGGIESLLVDLAIKVAVELGSLAAVEVAKAVFAEGQKMVAEATGTGWAAAPAPSRGRLDVDRLKPGPWELAEVEELPNGYVALRFHTGYLSAAGGGGAGVVADRPTPKAWERWKLVRNADETASFVSDKGFYLCAEGGGRGGLTADRAACGAWEKFQLRSAAADGKTRFYLVSDSGHYVSAQP